MNEKLLESSADEEILETQEESEEDDELIFRFFVNGEIVSWAKTLLYSHLKEIHTAVGKKSKEYGRKLLLYIEEIDRAHGATATKICCGESSSDEAVGFFRSWQKGFEKISKEIAKRLQLQEDQRQPKFKLTSKLQSA